MTSCERRDREAPVEGAFAGRCSGMRSRARSVRSSASVKSSVNQPSCSRPSIVLVAPAAGELRPVGDVGRLRDVVLVAGDEPPSRVATRSGSMKSAPIAIASS